MFPGDAGTVSHASASEPMTRRRSNARPSADAEARTRGATSTALRRLSADLARFASRGDQDLESLRLVPEAARWAQERAVRIIVDSGRSPVWLLAYAEDARGWAESVAKGDRRAAGLLSVFLDRLRRAIRRDARPATVDSPRVK